MTTPYVNKRFRDIKGGIESNYGIENTSPTKESVREVNHSPIINN